MRERAVGTAVSLCFGLTVGLPGGAGAASEHFVPAFSFWSGAPIEEEKSEIAPSIDVPRVRVPTPAFPRAHATLTASAAPTIAPGVVVLRANPSGAPSDPQVKDETQRWVPAFNFSSGALIQDFSGTFDGNRGFGSGDSRFVSPYMGASLEISTPGLSFIPTRPRLFARADVMVDFAFDRSTARNGAPENMDIANQDKTNPDRDPHFQAPGYPRDAIRGQGAKVDGEVNSWLFGGGVGAAFTLQVFERRLRIKPSVEYLRESVTMRGYSNTAVTLNPGNIPRQVPSRFLFFDLFAEKTKAFNLVGPGLEIEMDSVRLGPTMLALFANAKAFRTLSNRKITASVREDQRVGNRVRSQAADFSLTLPEWSYNLGLGLRMRWLPEDGWR